MNESNEIVGALAWTLTLLVVLCLISLIVGGCAVPRLDVERFERAVSAGDVALAESAPRAIPVQPVQFRTTQPIQAIQPVAVPADGPAVVLNGVPLK